MPYQIQKGNIEKLKVDVLINITNSNLSLRRLPSSSCELNEICRYLSPVPAGRMEVTPSFGLPARDVLHFSAPKQIDDLTKLREYYDSLLEEAAKIGGSSVAVSLFPAQNQTKISPQEVYETAAGAVKRFVQNSDRLVYLVVDDENQIPVSEGLEERVWAFINAKLDGHQAYQFERKYLESPPSVSAFMAIDLDDGDGELPFLIAVDSPETSVMETPTSSPTAKETPEPRRRSSSYAEVAPGGSGQINGSDDFLLPVTTPSEKEPTENTTTPRPKKMLACESAMKRPSDSQGRTDMLPHGASGFYDLDPQRDFLPEESFSQAVLRLIDAKGMTDPQCYSQANLSRAVFNKLKQSALNPNAPDYQPSKSTALALTIGLRLTKEEADLLLKKAGFAFSNSSRSDMIVEFFLMQKEYDIFEINEVLFRFGQQPLGSF